LPQKKKAYLPTMKAERDASERRPTAFLAEEALHHLKAMTGRMSSYMRAGRLNLSEREGRKRHLYPI